MNPHFRRSNIILDASIKMYFLRTALPLRFTLAARARNDFRYRSRLLAVSPTESECNAFDYSNAYNVTPPRTCIIDAE